MSWKPRFLSYRFYARNPVRLPTYLPADLTPAARQLLLKIYAEEIADIDSPSFITRWFIILPAWFAAMTRASWQNYWLHRPSIRRGLPHVSSATLAWRLFVTVFLTNIPPREFFRYKFYLTGKFAKRGYYLANWQLDPLLARSRPGRVPTTIGNKEGFWRIMSKAGLPVAPVHAIIRDSHWQKGSWGALESSGRDLVVKPAFLCRGRGIAFFDRHPEGGWLHDGRRVDASQVKAHIEALSREDTCVVQDRIDDHPVFRNLGIKGVITVRVITIKTRAMKDPIGLSASLRIPPASERMPNLDNAGLYCAVDWDTGTVHAGEGILPGLENLENHPETGARLAGLQVPLWSECKALCLTAHVADPGHNSMGWDVIISPDGPLLLEANPRWGSISAQMSSNPPLLQTRFPELYEEWPLNEPAPVTT